MRSMFENLEVAPMPARRSFPVPKSSASSRTPPSLTKAATTAESSSEKAKDGPMIISESVLGSRGSSESSRCTMFMDVPVASILRVGASFPSSYVDIAKSLVPFQPVL